MSSATQPVTFRKAAVVIVSTIAAVLMSLVVLVGAGAAYANAVAPQVPTRTILVIDSGKGAVVETDLAQGQTDQIVRVDGTYLHLNMDAGSVKEQGWKLTKEPIDPKSPIQAYDLAPVK